MSDFLSELVVGPLNVGNGRKNSTGQVPFGICGLGWRHPLPGAVNDWNSAEAVSISYKPYVKHLFNLHKKLLFPNYRRETCHTSPCATLPQPRPTFILTVLSPSLIPSSVSLNVACFLPSSLPSSSPHSFLCLD